MPSKTSKHLAATIAAVAMLGACAKAPAPVDTAKVESEVKAAMESSIAAFNAKDAAKSVAADAPDYVGMFHGVPNVVGPEQDLALTKQQVADATGQLEVSDVKIDVASSGDMATWTATYVYRTTNPTTKAPTVEYGNWVTIFRKQADGSMKMKTGVVSDTPPPQAAAPGA